MYNREYMEKHYMLGFNYGDEFNALPTASAEGSYIRLDDRKELIDYTGQLGAVITGNNNPYIKQHVIDAMNSFGFVWEESCPKQKEEVVEFFFEKMIKPNDEIEKMRFFVTGSEAVEASIVLAKETTNKDILLTHRFAYHGWTHEAKQCSDFPEFSCFIDEYGNYTAREDANTRFFEYPVCDHCPFGKDYDECRNNDQLFCVKMLRDKIEKLGPENIAAVFTDCMLGLAVVLPPKEYIKQFYQVIKEYELIWIDDEIFSAFRLGDWFAYQAYDDVKPDILCFGKSISNGMLPISGIAISKSIARKITNYRWQMCSTFAAHPLALTAVHANLNYILDNNILEGVKKKEVIFRKKLNDLKSKYSFIEQINGKGMFWGVELKPCGFAAATVERAPVLKRGESTSLGVLRKISLENGLLIGGYVPNYIRISPTLTLSLEEIDKSFTILDKSLSEYSRLCRT